MSSRKQHTSRRERFEATEDGFYLRRADVLIEIVQERYSCRAFLPIRVPEQTIETILLTAQRSASWQNTQPWEVIVTGVKATHRLSKLLIEHARVNEKRPDFFPPVPNGKHKSRAQGFADLCSKSRGLSKHHDAADKDNRVDELTFFGAPHLALITTAESLGPFGVLDCGGYMSYFMLAAQSLGVATTALASLTNYSDFWRQQVSLGPDRLVLSTILFGFEDTDHPSNQIRVPRVPIKQSVTWLDD